jgi:hypothetical protein
MKNMLMAVNTSVRLEKKNYNRDTIETIIHLKNKVKEISQKS